MAARAKGRIAAKLAPLLPADGVVAFDASIRPTHGSIRTGR